LILADLDGVMSQKTGIGNRAASRVEQMLAGRQLQCALSVQEVATTER